MHLPYKNVGFDFANKQTYDFEELNIPRIHIVPLFQRRLFARFQDQPVFYLPRCFRKTHILYEGKAHKLGDVSIVHEEDYMKPWRLIDDEGRLDFTMEPEYDRITRDKVLFVDNCTHQVFGRFHGHVTLDDGSILEIRDLPAFAEHAVNNW